MQPLALWHIFFSAERADNTANSRIDQLISQKQLWRNFLTWLYQWELLTRPFVSGFPSAYNIVRREGRGKEQTELRRESQLTGEIWQTVGFFANWECEKRQTAAYQCSVAAVGNNTEWGKSKCHWAPYCSGDKTEFLFSTQGDNLKLFSVTKTTPEVWYMGGQKAEIHTNFTSPIVVEWGNSHSRRPDFSAFSHSLTVSG